MALVPPAAAVAGIYTYVDSSRGVWIAPANVGFSTVTDVGVNLTDAQQSTLLNTPADGKAICGIRLFPATGPVVWGARTLDGNSDDWRYIQVRRTVIYIQQSIQLALENFVFSPNNSATWNTVNAMITQFLDGLWEQGGLFGISPEDAFNVSIGLGSTMTGEDVYCAGTRAAIEGIRPQSPRS
jgi:phage tail sheath protein FI